MIDRNNPEIQFAIRTVSQAARLAQQVQTELVSATLTKDDRSPVTVADFAVQALVARELKEAFPSATLVAEEDANALSQSRASDTLDKVTRFVSTQVASTTPELVCRWIDYGQSETGKRFWTLDPVDGTKGFLRGDQYAIALALLEDGQVRIGALGCPNLRNGWKPDSGGAGSLVIAALGQGCWVTTLDGESAFEQLSVSACKEAACARLMRSVEAGHTNTAKIVRLISLMDIGGEPVRMDSQAKYAVLASGQAELVLRLLSPTQPDYREKIWDQAAGALIIEEAGGRISDLHGAALDFSCGRTLAHNQGVLASNGALHEPALAALQVVGILP
jgi:3'(2'), 5'-bisphosphate nucleotidase